MAEPRTPTPGSVSLLEAAEQLGVHYMTAYRYVRTGRLPAHKQGSQWQVTQDDLDRFGEEAPAPGRRSRVDHTGRLVARLVVGDEGGAWTVVQRALTGGLEPDELYLEVLTPAMREIGERWSAGELSVADEHQASVVMLRLVGRLGPLFNHPGRSRGSVVLGAPAGDVHSLPTALFADLLRDQGLSVVQLGADTPADSFVEVARSTERLVAVGLSATLVDNQANLTEAVDALHQAGLGPVVLGGRAVTEATTPLEVGADHYTPSTADAVALFDRLADDAQRTRRRARRAEHERAAATRS